MVAPTPVGWTDTPALGCAACCLRFDPDARKLAIMPLRSSAGESVKVAVTQSPSRYRDDARNESRRPDKVVQASRLRWHAGTSVGYDARKLRVWADGLASGTLHNTHCPFGRAKTSHLNSFRADNSPPAGPFSAELRSDNVALCNVPLLRCHGDCCPAQKTPAPARSCPRRVAITAPACRHPSRQLRRSACPSPVGTGEGGAAG